MKHIAKGIAKNCDIKCFFGQKVKTQQQHLKYWGLSYYKEKWNKLLLLNLNSPVVKINA